MSKNNPPFEINNSILEMISEISELVGRITSTQETVPNPTLRRTNRIKTIHASLAIEQNTLTLEQVTAVLHGKHVLAPPKDIAEVKNAFEIYEIIDTLDPYSVEDLLNAHGVMTRGLIDDAGQFRSGAVGVVDKEGNSLHLGTLPDYVPKLVTELLEWTKESDFHPLVKGCVFHYELELIHPFSDGNGRIGRLWHTLLLTKWRPVFSWLPVESIVHDRQDEYYKAINRSNYEGSSTVFIEFMLSAIKEALVQSLETNNQINTAEMRAEKICNFLNTNKAITNADVRQMFGVSSATANRILSRLVNEGKLQKTRLGKSWGYTL